MAPAVGKNCDVHLSPAQLAIVPRLNPNPTGKVSKELEETTERRSELRLESKSKAMRRVSGERTCRHVGLISILVGR